jgi:hypothetical protein
MATKRPTKRPATKSLDEITHAQQLLAMRPALIDPNQDYSIDECAILLCSSHTGVYRLVRAGLLKLKKRGRRSRVSGAEIIRVNRVEL